MSRLLPPLAWAALTLFGALALGLRLPGAGAAVGVALAIPFAVLALLRAAPGPPVSAFAALAAAGYALGAAGGQAARHDCRALLPDGARVVVRGVFEARPAPGAAAPFRLDAIRPVTDTELRGGTGADKASAPARGNGAGPRAAAAPVAEAAAGKAAPGSQMPASAAGSPAAGTAWLDCTGTVRARPPAGQDAVVLEAGVPVEGRGQWWAAPLESPWPRPPEFSGTLILHGIAASTAGPEPQANALLRLRDGAQARLRRLLPERAALAEALILAQTGGLDPEVRRRFALSGLSHLLSISGQHVGLIAGTLLLLFRLARIAPRAADGASAAAITTYVLFLGAPHAATRAALLLLLALAARILQRPADPYALLAAAAFPLLVLDPMAALDPGFQLSFAGVAGLIALRRRLLEPLRPKLGRWLADSIATSLAATLATAPIAALHFGTVAPVGILANLPAVPLVAAAVPATALALGASVVSWPAGQFLAGAADLLLAALDEVARAAAAVPGGHAFVPADQVGAWVLATVAAACVAGWLARAASDGARIRAGVRRTVAAGAALALLLAWPAVVGRAGGGALEIHAIDVGQGDAFAIRTPDRRWILVDAGPRTDRYDAGRARVVPYLLRHGVRRVDALILTHPDADHIGGAAAVLEAFDVGVIVDPGRAAGKPLYVDLLKDAAAARVQWREARSGRELRAGDVVLHFLYPDGARDSLDGPANANDLSAVFRLTYGGFAAMFMGDAPAAVEEILVRRHGDGLRAQVLKVGHHGSSTSTSDSFLAAVDPEVALVSVGRRNRYGHPAPTVIRRLERHGVRVLRTDLSGHVALRVQPDGRIEVETTR